MEPAYGAQHSGICRFRRERLCQWSGVPGSYCRRYCIFFGGTPAMPMPQTLKGLLVLVAQGPGVLCLTVDAVLAASGIPTDGLGLWARLRSGSGARLHALFLSGASALAFALANIPD